MNTPATCISRSLCNVDPKPLRCGERFLSYLPLLLQIQRVTLLLGEELEVKPKLCVPKYKKENFHIWARFG